MLPSTTRSALLLALLCACPGPKDSDTEGDPSTGDTTGQTSGDTTGATTGQTSDPSTSDTTGDTTSGSSGDTGGSSSGGDFPACTAPDPAVVGGYSFDISAWAPKFDPFGFGDSVLIDVVCTVESPGTQGDAFQFTLSCPQDGAAIAVPVSLTLPGDVAPPLADQDSVHVGYAEHNEDVDLLPGSFFTIHTADKSKLLLAGYADQIYLEKWSAQSAPLGIEVIGGLCPCEGGSCSFDEPGTERRALRVTDAAANAVDVLDRQRGELVGDGATYDVLVPAAVEQFCLNCFGDYRALIVARP